MALKSAIDDGNWDAAIWNPVGTPDNTDDVQLDGHAVIANIDAECNTLVGTAGSSLELTKHDFTSTGAVLLNNIAITTAADMEGVTFTASDIGIGAVGSLTLSDSLALTANLTLGAGILDMGGYDIELSGNLWDGNVGGSFLNVGTIIFVGDGTIEIPIGAPMRTSNIVVDDGVTLTLAAHTMVASFIVADTATIVGGGFPLSLNNPANDFLKLPIDRVSGLLVVILDPMTCSNDYVIDTGGAALGIEMYAGVVDQTFAQTQNVYCKDLGIIGQDITSLMTLDMSAAGVVLAATGNVRLGLMAAANISGELILSNERHSISGIITRGNAANEKDAITLNTADIVLGGIFDGAGDEAHPIAVTSSAARFLSGALADVDVDGNNRIIAWGCTDGGGNGIGVEFAPRQLGTMAVAA